MIQRLKNWLIVKLGGYTTPYPSFTYTFKINDGSKKRRVRVAGFPKVTPKDLKSPALPIKPKDAKPHRKNRRN